MQTPFVSGAQQRFENALSLYHGEQIVLDARVCRNYLPESVSGNVAQAVGLHAGLAACATGHASAGIS